VEGPASQPLTPTQQSLEQSLRAWRKAEAAKTGKPAFIVFSDTVLTNIVYAHPQTINDLLNVSGIGPEKSDRYGAAVIAICRGEEAPAALELPPQKEVSFRAKPRMGAVEQTQHLARTSTPATREPQLRMQTTQQPTLTPDQQALDTRLRAWRATEAERLNLPQFFVLGTAALRNIAMERPRTLTELKMIDGISLEKAEKFGPSIVEICSAQ
jgi:ATP-dependent DNA helicase RecQ